MAAIRKKLILLTIITPMLYLLLIASFAGMAIFLWLARWGLAVACAVPFLLLCYTAPVCLRAKYRARDDYEIAGVLKSTPWASLVYLSERTNISIVAVQESINRCRRYGISRGGDGAFYSH